MSSKKTIAIVGATGTQGQSVANTFLSLPNWHVRGLTRNTASEKAKALEKAGAEVVAADLNDIESLRRAFAGAHAIFVNTDFWLPYAASRADGVSKDEASKYAFDLEITHARNAAVAASGVPSLERYVYSALGPMKRASAGKYTNSYHWDAKAASVDYIESELPDLRARTSFFYPGCYNTNDFLFPKRDPASGAYELLIPCAGDTVFPILDAARSSGPFVRALVEDEPAGTKLLAYDSSLTVLEAMRIWQRITGKDAQYVELSLADMEARTGLPLEVLHGPAFIGDYHYMAGVEGYITPEQLRTRPVTQSYEDFLKQQSSDFLLKGGFPSWL